jgi:hypothetical protein
MVVVVRTGGVPDVESVPPELDLEAQGWRSGVAGEALPLRASAPAEHAMIRYCETQPRQNQ